MFTRLFKSAKTLLAANNPGTGIETGRPAELESAFDDIMVTTRGSSYALHAEDGEALPLNITDSSRKRQKLHDESTAASLTTEELNLPVRSKDDEVQTRTTVVVEIPVRRMSTSEKAEFLVDSRGSKDEDELEREEAGPVGDDAEPEELVAEAKTVEDDAHPEESREILDSAEESDGSEEAPDTEGLGGVVTAFPSIQPPQGPVVLSIPQKSTHKRFGSVDIEEPEIDMFSTAVEKVDSEDESSDDDEAPEVVEAQDAKESIRAKERAAEKAVAEREALKRQKNIDREANLRRQADSANKKRKRTIDVDNEPMNRGTVNSKKTRVDILEEETADGEIGQDEPKVTKTFAQQRLYSSRGPLPDLLPEEYLEDELVETPTHTESETLPKRHKKIKFEDLTEKKPKDRRKGSTIYRVAKVQSTKLAPKSSKQAKLVKESWLQGRPGKATGTNRKPYSRGFLVKR